jgi:hypothetical protein
LLGQGQAGGLADLLLSFKSLAATALTFTVASSMQSAHAQKMAGPSFPATIAGFELPEGAQQDSRNPERLFISQTENFILDGASQSWVDSQTGQVLGPARAVFFGPPKGARRDKGKPDRAFNPQNDRNFVWDAGIEKWIDMKTDRAFNPVCIDEAGRPAENFALSSASAGRGQRAVDPAVRAGAEFGSRRVGLFAEEFGYYFNGVAGTVSGEMKFCTGRDAYRYLLGGEPGDTSKFPRMDDWMKGLFTSIDERFATVQIGRSPWQITPAFTANLSIPSIYQSWWTAPDGKLASGFLAGTTVGVKLVPDFPIAEKSRWSGYAAAGNLTFSFSDIRLKRDIVNLAVLDNGIGLSLPLSLERRVLRRRHGPGGGKYLTSCCCVRARWLPARRLWPRRLKTRDLERMASSRRQNGCCLPQTRLQLFGVTAVAFA